MIYLDRRAGSAELFTLLQARRLPVDLTTLRFGDVAFEGKGPGGPVMVGVERKRIRDLLASLTSGRLSGHQLPGLVEEYSYRWLLVEGNYRETDEGLIEVPRGHGKPWERIRFRYQALESYLLTLQLRGGLALQRTYGDLETCAWLESLWKWWTQKEWQAHRSHLALHQPADAAIWVKPTLVQRVAAQLPGIDEKARVVGRTFPTVLRMAVAGEDQWTQIPGIGKIGAARIVKALQEPE